MASSLYVCTDIYQLHMMIFAFLNERRCQMRSNMRMLALSRRFFIDKKMAAKKKGKNVLGERRKNQGLVDKF